MKKKIDIMESQMGTLVQYISAKKDKEKPITDISELTSSRHDLFSGNGSTPVAVVETDSSTVSSGLSATRHSSAKTSTSTLTLTSSSKAETKTENAELRQKNKELEQKAKGVQEELHTLKRPNDVMMAVPREIEQNPRGKDQVMTHIDRQYAGRITRARTRGANPLSNRGWVYCLETSAQEIKYHIVVSLTT